MCVVIASQALCGHGTLTKLTKTFCLHAPLGMSPPLLLSSAGCGDPVVLPDLWALLAQGPWGSLGIPGVGRGQSPSQRLGLS